MKPPGPLSAEEIGLVGSRPKSTHPNGEETNETPEQEFQWPRSLCSVDSLGNLKAVDKKLQEETEVKHAHSSSSDSSDAERAYISEVYGSAGIRSGQISDRDISTKPRCETAKATYNENEKLLVAYIDHTVLTQALSSQIMKQIEYEMDMITKFPFLENFTRPTRLRLINHFKKEQMLRNSVLYRQGDEFTHIYLILFGEFSEKRTNVSRSDVDGESPQKDRALKKNFSVNKAADNGSDSEIRILKSF